MGPVQAGQGPNGQYVHCIEMSHPTEEHVAEHGVHAPNEFAQLPDCD